MGTNVIYLADRVPSYRRSHPHPSRPAPQTSMPPAGTWAALARERATQRQASLFDTAPAFPAAPSATACAPRPTLAPPILRVTRLAENTANGPGLARVRISGRLIDVCAELDRLAAAETAPLSAQPLRA